MIDTLIDRVIKREGGFVDHPDDRGGPTKYGITGYTLASWRNEGIDSDDVEALTVMEARDIYLAMYWQEAKLDLLPVSPVLQEMLFDAAVQHDPYDATRFLQRAVNSKPDGLIGPNTIAAVEEMESDMVAARFMSERLKHYGQLITSNPSQAVFAHGWMNRMSEFVTAIPAA